MIPNTFTQRGVVCGSESGYCGSAIFVCPRLGCSINQAVEWHSIAGYDSERPTVHVHWVNEIVIGVYPLGVGLELASGASVTSTASELTVNLGCQCAAL